MTTTYTFEQLKEDVRKEAEALRVHATKRELGRLNFQELDVLSKRSCIYGQMTGDCFSNRAANLIYSCTPRYFTAEVMVSDDDDRAEITVDSLLSHVNGSKVKGFKNERTDFEIEGTHYSAIEAYILLPEARNENLIAFLRGETETLTL